MKEAVKLLREQTGQGMLDCKKALEESGGDIEKAKVYLANQLRPAIFVSYRRD